MHSEAIHTDYVHFPEKILHCVLYNVKDISVWGGMYSCFALLVLVKRIWGSSGKKKIKVVVSVYKETCPCEHRPCTLIRSDHHQTHSPKMFIPFFPVSNYKQFPRLRKGSYKVKWESALTSLTCPEYFGAMYLMRQEASY